MCLFRSESLSLPPPLSCSLSSSNLVRLCGHIPLLALSLIALSLTLPLSSTAPSGKGEGGVLASSSLPLSSLKALADVMGLSEENRLWSPEQPPSFPSLFPLTHCLSLSIFLFGSFSNPVFLSPVVTTWTNTPPTHMHAPTCPQIDQIQIRPRAKTQTHRTL